MKLAKKLIAGLVATLLVAGTLPFSAFATVENTPKEEVVYINLNADGSVQEINVVNIFELDTAGTIVDYGVYDNVRNMTSNAEITCSDAMVTVDADAGKLYYEGALSSKTMPWNIQIKYYLDGTEYSASDVAGKSGELKITMVITENTDCIGNFYEGFALQASLSLDTKKCTDIKADGATVANVGSNKQLTYTILPNTGANIEITANVTDFELSGISINGIKLNLSIEINEAVIQDMIDDVVAAVNDLDDGATNLNDGAKELFDGTSLLDSKTNDLCSGIDALASGAASLSSGLSAITKNNNALINGAYTAFQGICSASERVLNAELSKNGLNTVTLTPETYASVLTNLLNDIDSDSVYDTAYQQALTYVTEQVEANEEALYAGYIEQNADVIYQTYIESQAEAIYTQVATQTLLDMLVSNGFTEEEARSSLDSDTGKALIANTVSNLTDDQKQQIVSGALESLTDAQKAQIRAGAVASLSDDQKTQIKEGYIEQTMKSEEVTSQITAAVAAASSAVASIADLKGQLDNYSLFYEGLQDYTSAVSEAASGAATLKENMDVLNENTGTLKNATGTLNEGTEAILDGTNQLKNGTGEFADAVAGMEEDVNETISSMIADATGSEVEVGSFVSENNTNVSSVQFVIQTEAIEMTEPITNEPDVVETLTFWQKLLRLFGLY